MPRDCSHSRNWAIFTRVCRIQPKAHSKKELRNWKVALLPSLDEEGRVERAFQTRRPRDHAVVVESAVPAVEAKSDGEERERRPRRRPRRRRPEGEGGRPQNRPPRQNPPRDDAPSS